MSRGPASSATDLGLATDGPPRRRALANLARAGLGELAERIAREHHVAPSALCGPGRTSRTGSRARGAFIAALRALPTPLSYPEIGALLHLDHTTAMHLHRLARARP